VPTAPAVRTLPADLAPHDHLRRERWNV
jgi:predicted secreted hydrolase